MSTALRALIVEDSQNDCDLLLAILHKGGYDVTYRRAYNAEMLSGMLEEGRWDIVISDYSMPGFTGTDALAMVRGKSLDVPFVFFSGTIGEEIAVHAMRSGAQDYVIKGKSARLLPAIQRELREAELRGERKQMEQRLRQLEKFEALGKLAGGVAHDFNNVIGAIMGWAEIGVDRVPSSSPEANLFQRIREQATRAAGLTRQLLAYARRQVLAPRSINLNQMINETRALLQKTIDAQIEMKAELAPDLSVARRSIANRAGHHELVFQRARCDAQRRRVADRNAQRRTRRKLLQTTRGRSTGPLRSIVGDRYRHRNVRIDD